MEISPAVPELILIKYNEKFKDVVGVAQPELIQGLKKVKINKNVSDIEEQKIKIDIPPNIYDRRPSARNLMIVPWTNQNQR
jgi:hypothetical protein